MKKAILFLLTFITVYYLFYAVLFVIKISGKPLIAIVQQEFPIDKNVVGKTMEEFDVKQHYNILFLGSSHCYREFDPALFETAGYTSYNLGSSAQAPLNSYCLLKKYINNTDVVVLETFPDVGNISGKEAYYYFASSVNDYGICADMALELNDLRCYNVLSIKPFIDHYNKLKSYNIENSYKGYVATADTAGLNVVYDHQVLQKANMDKQLVYVEKIIRLCLEQGKKLVFVYAPVPPELNLENDNYYTEKVHVLASQYHIPFYDKGHHHNLKSHEHFFDDDHLNVAGVKIFNTEVLEQLKKDVLQ